jgi:GntR family transcriptional repressor for pyruvate dehydrogenase complex
MNEAPAIQISGRHFLAGRSASLSAQIVADVRDALFEKRLKPGELIGTEKDLAARYRVSRIVARDALRTLEALGIADIRMGKGGGARVARGNPRLFAEALAVQLDLTGVSAAEIMDAQRAIETLAAELAAEHATPADHARLKRLLAEAEACIDDPTVYTRSSREFHLAVAEASHNRVLEPHADAGSLPPCARSAQGARRADRDARRRRRPCADGRPREDDPSPARRRVRREGT